MRLKTWLPGLFCMPKLASCYMSWPLRMMKPFWWLPNSSFLGCSYFSGIERYPSPEVALLSIAEWSGDVLEGKCLWETDSFAPDKPLRFGSRVTGSRQSKEALFLCPWTSQSKLEGGGWGTIIASEAEQRKIHGTSQNLGKHSPLFASRPKRNF